MQQKLFHFIAASQTYYPPNLPDNMLTLMFVAVRDRLEVEAAFFFFSGLSLGCSAPPVAASR
jgi:hypothetical protein